MCTFLMYKFTNSLPKCSLAMKRLLLVQLPSGNVIQFTELGIPYILKVRQGAHPEILLFGHNVRYSAV